MITASPIRKPCPASQTGEQGYLLLLVVAIVALLLITMALAAPKLKDQIRRDREYELRHRGMAYAHAVKLYYKKFSSYPTNINQLINTNNTKFLRKKYVDPITGNKVWRPVYFGFTGTGDNSNPNCSQSGSSFNGSSGSSSIFGQSGSGLGSPSTGSTFGGSSNTGGGSTFGSGNSSTNCPAGSTATNGSGNNNGTPVDSVTAAVNGLSGNAAIPGSNSAANGSQPPAPKIGPDTVLPDPAGFLTPATGFGSGALSSTVAGGGFGASSPTSSFGSNGQSGGGIGGAGGTSTFGSGGFGAATGAFGSIPGAGGQIVGVASFSREQSNMAVKGKDHYNDLEFYYDPTKDFGGVAGMTGTGVGGGAGNTLGQPTGGSPSGLGFGNPSTGNGSSGGFGGGLGGNSGGGLGNGGSGFGSGSSNNGSSGSSNSNGGSSNSNNQLPQ